MWGLITKDMETFEISVKRFDEFASAFAEKFMNIDSYRKRNN